MKKIIQAKKTAKEVMENLNGREGHEEIMEAVFSIGSEKHLTNEQRNAVLNQVMIRIVKNNKQRSEII